MLSDSVPTESHMVYSLPVQKCYVNKMALICTIMILYRIYSADHVNNHIPSSPLRKSSSVRVICRFINIYFNLIQYI